MAVVEEPVALVRRDELGLVVLVPHARRARGVERGLELARERVHARAIGAERDAIPRAPSVLLTRAPRAAAQRAARRPEHRRERAIPLVPLERVPVEAAEAPLDAHAVRGGQDEAFVTRFGDEHDFDVVWTRCVRKCDRRAARSEHQRDEREHVPHTHPLTPASRSPARDHSASRRRALRDRPRRPCTRRARPATSRGDRCAARDCA